MRLNVYQLSPLNLAINVTNKIITYRKYDLTSGRLSIYVIFLNILLNQNNICKYSVTVSLELAVRSTSTTAHQVPVETEARVMTPSLAILVNVLLGTMVSLFKYLNQC